MASGAAVLPLPLDRVGTEGALVPHRCAYACEGRSTDGLRSRWASAVPLSVGAQSNGVGSGSVDCKPGPLGVSDAAWVDGAAWVRGRGKLGSLSYDNFKWTVRKSGSDC